MLHQCASRSLGTRPTIGPLRTPAAFLEGCEESSSMPALHPVASSGLHTSAVRLQGGNVMRKLLFGAVATAIVALQPTIALAQREAIKNIPGSTGPVTRNFGPFPIF